MNLRWLIPLPLALTGFALGFLHDDAGTRVRESVADSRSAPPRPALRGAREEPGLSLAQKIALACREPGMSHRMHDLLELFRSLDAGELHTAADAVFGLPDAQRWEPLRALFARWLETDPGGAADFAAHRTDRNVLTIVLTEWAWADPDAAMRWMRAKKPDLDLTFAVQLPGFVYNRSCTDPARVIALLGGFSSPMTNTVLSLGWTEWAKKNPTDAMNGALGVENSKRRADALEGVMRGWTENDPKGAAAWFGQVADEKLRRELASGLITGLAAKDAVAALALARSLPEGPDRNHGLAAAAHALYDHGHREAAVEVGKEIPFDGDNADVRGFYWRWMITDPGAATRGLLERASRSDEERAAVEEYVMSDKDYPAMGGTDVSRISAKAAALAEVEDVPADDFRRRLLENVVTSWATGDAASARSWAEALPESAARERALAGVAAGWISHSVNEVGAWLDRLPASPSRDAAVGSFARDAFPRDPDSALAWMQTIPDAGKRASLLQDAWRKWAQSDRSKAEQWRETSPELSAAERARLK